MPLVDLSNDDLKRAALSARAQAFRHEEQAKRGEDAAEPHLEQAKRYRELARRLEAAGASRGAS
jgi:hypothetical protein